MTGGGAGAHEGRSWWTPVRIVLVLAAVGWMAAITQKQPCAADDWSGSNVRYAAMCYSDLPFLYVPRGFAEREVPFSDSAGRYPDLEYPVLIGYFAYASAVVDQWTHGPTDLEKRAEVPVDRLYADPGVERERRAYFGINALMLTPFALLTAWFLAGVHRRRPRDAVLYAVAPVLVATGLVNWDLLAVCATAGALWAWARGRPLLTGVFLGLGTAAKLYPVFVLGAVLVLCLRSRAWRSLGVAVAGAVGAWVLCNAPAVLTYYDGWAGFWSFNNIRGADLGSLWLLAQQLGHPSSVHTINVVSQVVVILVSLGVLALGLVAPEPPRLAQLAVLVVIGFLIVNKVYSPQYVLWILPLAVIARPKWRDLLWWQAAELFYFAMVWFYLGQYTAAASTGATDAAYAVAIVVRVLAELAFAALVVRDMLRPEHDLVREERLPVPVGVRSVEDDGVERRRGEAHLHR